MKMKALRPGQVIRLRDGLAQVVDLRGEVVTVRYDDDTQNEDLDSGLRGQQFFRVALLERLVEVKP